MDSAKISGSHDSSNDATENPYKARFTIKKGYYRSYIHVNRTWIQKYNISTIQKIVNVQELPVPLDDQGDLQRIEFSLLRYARNNPAFFGDTPSSVEFPTAGVTRGVYSELTIASPLKEDDDDEGVVIRRQNE